MLNTECVIFSKCRTLQLKSCIRSLVALSDAEPRNITVLYLDSEKVSYEPLKKDTPCRFIKETDFYNDILSIVKESRKPFIHFMVDDLIFRDRFSYAAIEDLMSSRPEIDCFSLRLGKNIRDGITPDFEELKDGILLWKTAKGLGRSWNYFWEISSSIYRKKLVLDYLKRCRAKEIAFPNPFEFRYYSIMPNIAIGERGILRILANPRYILWRLFSPQRMVNQIACYSKSRAFTQGINLVAKRDSYYDTYITSEKLHELFLEGYEIDFKCLEGVPNAKPNAGRQYFRIVGRKGEIHPLSVWR